MRDRPYGIGDSMLLSNPNTQFGYNNIPRPLWGTEGVVCRVESFKSEVAAYWVRFGDGTIHHVIHSMLSRGAVPW